LPAGRDKIIAKECNVVLEVEEIATMQLTQM